jgi:hypothetical protein
LLLVEGQIQMMDYLRERHLKRELMNPHQILDHKILPFQIDPISLVSLILMVIPPIYLNHLREVYNHHVLDV